MRVTSRLLMDSSPILKPITLNLQGSVSSQVVINKFKTHRRFETHCGARCILIFALSINSLRERLCNSLQKHCAVAYSG